MGTFQSLVGTLKTEPCNADCAWYCEFQSLVGTLKTKFFGIIYVFTPLFQSLVGTLKTTQGDQGRVPL